MKKYLKIINLMLLSLISLSANAQIGSYHTVTSPMIISEPFLPYANNITIGVYPDMAVSYHDVTVSPGNFVGYVTINKNASLIHRIELFPHGLRILDMVQHDFTNRIFFCGTKGDTVGVLGYFDIDSVGSFVEIYCDEVPYSVRLSKLVEYKGNGMYNLAAYGDGSVKMNGEYIFVDVPLQYFPNPLYYVSGLGHAYKPFGIVCTDNYISLYSHNTSKDRIYARRFLRSNLYDPMCNYLYEYPVSSEMTFGPMATFLGEEYYSDNSEDEVAIVYMTKESNVWKTYMKRLELNNMDMICDHVHTMHGKSGLFGLTYLAVSKKLAVLELLDPGYSSFNSSVVMFEPMTTSTYTADVFHDVGQNDYNSMGRLYSAGYTVNHFVAGYTHNNNGHWWAQDDVVNTSDPCAYKGEVKVKVTPPTTKSLLSSPLSPIARVLNLNSILQASSTYSSVYPCTYSIR